MTPRKPPPVEARDRTTLLRIDGMTATEQAKFSAKIKKAKKDTVSDEARATLVEGKSLELPSQIRTLISDKSR